MRRAILACLLAMGAGERGQHVTIGLGEPLRNRAHGVLRCPDPIRNDRPMGHRAGVSVPRTLT